MTWRIALYELQILKMIVGNDKSKYSEKKTRTVRYKKWGQIRADYFKCICGVPKD